MEWKTIIWFILTLLLMGFFAGIEMAYYSANRLSIELKKKQGGVSGELLAKFVDSPASFLGMTLAGFTLFLVFFSLQVDNVMKPAWFYLGQKINWEIPASVHIITEIVLATFVVADLRRVYPPRHIQSPKPFPAQWPGAGGRFFLPDVFPAGCRSYQPGGVVAEICF